MRRLVVLVANLVVILLCMFALTSLAQPKKTEPFAFHGNSKHVKQLWEDGWFSRYEIDDHEFLLYRSPNSDELLHAPDCSACKTKRK